MAWLFLAAPAAAQVDPSGAWRTWHSQHFRVHAQGHLADAAALAAREAERAYRLLSQELRPPRGTIDLVVADNADYSNGYTTVFPSSRLTVHLAPPGGSPSIGNYDAWLRLVLLHELAHLFHLDQSGGVWGVLQEVFGRAPGLFPNMYQPSWVTEGVATYYESHFSIAGRIRGSYHRSLLAAAAADGVWLSSADVWGSTGRWPAGLRPYAWGAEFVALRAVEQGDSVVPRFIRRTSRQFWPFLVSRPLAKAGTRGVGNGWRDLRKRVEVPPTSAFAGRVVIRRGLRQDPHPRVSPALGRLAYVEDDGRNEPRIVVVDLPTGQRLASHRVNGEVEIAWVGDTLYVSQLEFRSPVDVVKDLHRWLPSGEWETVTRDARLDRPFRAPGDRVGAVALGAQGRVLVLPTGASARPLETPPADGWGRVATSPDGRRVAAARHLAGRWDIVVWGPADPDAAIAVTSDQPIDADPAWSADGATLYFSSEREGLSQIYAYAVGDGSITRVTSERAGAREPAPTADGRLVYVTSVGDGSAIVHAPIGGTAPVSDSEADGAPFVAAPEVVLAESGYRPWPALRPHYWLPFGHDEGSSGFFLNALTTAGDPIGRTSYYAIAGASARPFRWEATVGVVHRRWKRFELDGSLSQDWDGFVVPTSGGGVAPVAERERRAELGGTWRWRRWRSSIAVRGSGGLEGWTYFDDRSGGGRIASSPTFFSAGVAARAVHASLPGLALSLENGIAVDGWFERRWSLSDSLWSYEIRGGLSGYLALPLPGSAHWVLAARVDAGRTGGPAAEALEMGGESGDLLETIPGLPLGSGRRAFPLRGYPEGGAFTRVVVGALELRVPLLTLARGVPKLPIFLDRLSLAVFGEVGGGWDAGEAAVLDAYRAVGGELVVHGSVITDYPLRVRVGAAVPLREGLGARRGEVRGYVAFGTSF